MLSEAAVHSTEMATASAFSYAQAAKGQGAVAPITSTNSPLQSQESQATASVPKEVAPVENSIESTESDQGVDAPVIQAEKQEVASNLGSEAGTSSEPTQDRRSESTKEEDASRLDRPWRRNDKGTRSSSMTTRSVDEHDTRRTRKNKKTKSSEKTPSEQPAADKEQEAEPEPPKIELSEAPIPSVNIWQQRIEAQQAKVKNPSTDSAEDASNAQSAGSAAKSVEDISVAVPSRESSANGVKPHRKAGDASRPERNASRGARLAEKEARDGKTEAPPAVTDAASWPTPETAIKEEKKKPTDKADRSDKDAQEDANQSKPRSKEKWVAYDYVPTVNFETQLPQMRSSKPRGGARGANTTKATGVASTGDKPTTTAPANKLAESRERPREIVNGAVRTTSLPPSTKRTVADTPTAREQKKPSGHNGADKAKEATPNASVGYILLALNPDSRKSILTSFLRSRIILPESVLRLAARGLVEGTAAVVAIMLSTHMLNINMARLVLLLAAPCLREVKVRIALNPGRATMAKCICQLKEVVEAAGRMQVVTSIACLCQTEQLVFLLSKPSSALMNTQWHHCLP